MPIKNIKKFSKYIKDDYIVIHSNTPTKFAETGTHFCRPLTDLEKKNLNDRKSN